MSETLCYLDNNATTRVDPRVVEAMLPLLSEQYGNPSSMHRFGAQIGARIEEARAEVAAIIGGRDSEIIFTSGGTEADNHALRGVLAARPQRRHLVIAAVEHHAILEPAEAMRREGLEVSVVGVNENGQLDLDQLRSAIRADTALVSLMLANNETGVIFPIPQAAAVAHEKGALLHCDAVNALGKLAIQVDHLGVDLLSMSAHKLHGPKGSGALWVRRGVAFVPQQLGGPQERQRRGGTQNTAGIIGFAAACKLAMQSFDGSASRMRGLRDRLERELRSHGLDVYIAGEKADRLDNTCCACFAGVSAEAVLLLLSEADICVSSGAACSSGSLEPSHVLQAMKLDPFIAQGEIRFSFSRENSEADVDRVMSVLPDVLRRVKAANVM